MSVPRSRLLDLMKVQCRIFASTYNPEGVRTGNKILRQRLRGPALATYYPRKLVTHKDIAKAFADIPELEGPVDEEEEWRLELLEDRKARGKGAPKKKKGPPELKPKPGKK